MYCDLLTKSLFLISKVHQNSHFLTFLGFFLNQSLLIFQHTNKRKTSAIAIINSGAIRAAEISGEITRADLLQIDPFENSLEFLEIKGSILRTVFEKSAQLLTPENELNPDGGFLQVSGMYSLLLVVFIW